MDPSLGLALGTMIILSLGAIFIYHACHRESDVDRKSFLWGGFVFTVLTTVLLAVAGIGPYLRRNLDSITNVGDVPQPDWMGREWNPRLIWVFIAVGGYLIVTRLLKVRMPWQSAPRGGTQGGTTTKRRQPRAKPQQQAASPW